MTRGPFRNDTRALDLEVAADLLGLVLRVHKNSADGLRLAGEVALLDRRTKDAIVFFRSANAIKPLDPQIVMPLVQALFADGHFSEGENLSFALIRRHKHFSPIYEVLYQQYLLQKRQADAQRILEEKIRSNPNNASYVAELARFYYKTGNAQAMNGLLQKLLDPRQSFDEAQLEAGKMFLSIGRPADALSYFEKGAASDPKHSLIYRKACVDALEALGRTDDAALEVETLSKEYPRDPDVRLGRASLLLAAGKISEARSAYESLAAEKPNDAAIQYLYGRALLESGNRERARDQFEKSTAAAPAYLAPQVALASMSINAGDFATAVRYCDRILEQEPRNNSAALMRSAALIGSKRFGDARIELERLVKDEPALLDAKVQLGNLDLIERRYRDAQLMFQLVRAANASNVPALQGLADALIAQGEKEAAIRTIKTETTKSPDSVALHKLLAEVAEAAGDRNLAIAEYERLDQSSHGTLDLKLRLGKLYCAERNFAAAVAELRKVRALYPRDETVARDLADAMSLAGNSRDAMNQYHEALMLKSDDAMAMNNLAYTEAQASEKLDEALAMATRANELSPGNAVFQDTLSWVYVKKGEPANAIPVLKRLALQRSESASAHYHLGAALLEAGNRSQGKAELQAALSHSASEQERAQVKALLAR